MTASHQMIDTIEWSHQQDGALRAVSAWLAAGDQPVFRLFGYAGSGKTTLARELAAGSRSARFAAYTGKASLVLAQKGCGPVSTIHSLIYKPYETEDGVAFLLNPDSELTTSDLLIVDEVSMVNEELALDLLSFRVPILVLGDPAQLPPVKGAGYFINAQPDVMLTEIHRQARDNPIIRLATAVREGGRLWPGDYGAARVIKRNQLGQSVVMAADQVLVGLNRTRIATNGKMRTLLGRPDEWPVAGDKLVCLKNNKEKGLLNGGLWTVREVLDRRPFKEGTAIGLIVDPDDGVGAAGTKVCVAHHFFVGREDELSAATLRWIDQFTFGYALTVHKAQGSQWDSVVLFDESFVFKEQACRWLYTGLTRAARTIVAVQYGSS